jgi:RimJ/RimL family protein N-acetyltransferase
LTYPHAKSRRIALRPATAADSETFYRTLLSTGIESLPSIDTIAEDFGGLDALFLIESRATGEVFGYSTLHGHNEAGHIEMGVYTDTERARHGMGVEALMLTINYAFLAFNVDKLYIRTTEASFAGVDDYMGKEGWEGTFFEHLYFQGTYWNLHSYVMLRSEWVDYGREMAPLLGVR